MPVSARVLLTHGEGRLEGLAAALRARGLSVRHHPLIATEFLDSEDVHAAAEALLGCDWLLLTSRTAVQAWAALGLPLAADTTDTTHPELQLGVVGAKTAAEVVRLGGTVALTADPANALGLLATFRARVAPPARIGLPCGEQALPTLAAGLEQAGFSVFKVYLYRTVQQPFRPEPADLIVVASPSAVSALPAALDPQTRFVALGSSTAAALAARGWQAAEAPTPDVGSIVATVQAVLRATPKTEPRAVPLEIS